MSKCRKTYDDDDGRVIANMNVEGMPWHGKGVFPSEPEEDEKPPQQFNKPERRAIMTGAMIAVLLIGLVFLTAAFLFFLFCDFVWLR